MPDPAALVRMRKSNVVEVLYLFGDAVDRLIQSTAVRLNELRRAKDQGLVRSVG